MFDRWVNRWLPSHYYRGPALLVLVSFMGILVTLLIKQITGSSINRYPEAIYTLAFLFALIKYFSFLKYEPMVWLAFGTALLPLVTFAINYLIDPVSAVAFYQWEQLPRIMMFMAVAWWLGNHERTHIIFLVVAFLGLLIAIGMDQNFSRSMGRLTAGNRVDFGILNAQHVGLYFSIALVGFLTYGWKALRIQKLILRISIIGLIFIGTGLSLIVVIGSQTRAAWLALVICLGVWVVVQIKYLLTRQIQSKYFRLILPILLIGFGSVIYFNDNIKQRVSAESNVIELVISGDFDNIPMTSIGIRINTWIVAFENIAQRPIIGWGARSRGSVINDSDRLPKKIKERFGHFHNTIIEFGLAYGLLAILLLVSVYAWILIGTRKAVLAGYGSKETWQFTAYGTIVFVVMNQFESYLFFWSGIYASQIYLAPAFSVMLAHRFHMYRISVNG